MRLRVHIASSKLVASWPGKEKSSRGKSVQLLAVHRAPTNFSIFRSSTFIGLPGRCQVDASEQMARKTWSAITLKVRQSRQLACAVVLAVSHGVHISISSLHEPLVGWSWGTYASYFGLTL
jgi:hypothetical protein